MLLQTSAFITLALGVFRSTHTRHFSSPTEKHQPRAQTLSSVRIGEFSTNGPTFSVTLILRPNRLSAPTDSMFG